MGICGTSTAPGTSARFGLVVRGHYLLTLDGEPDPIGLASGDCYVSVRGSCYELRDELRSATQNCFDLIGSRVGGTVKVGGGGAPARVITGWLMFDEPGARPLLKLMPALLHATFDRCRTSLLHSTLELLEMETADDLLESSVVISRLADVLFVQAIRAHAASNEDHDGSWLSALAERHLGPALHAIHQDTARAWSVEALAAIADMSRSAASSNE